ncbi:hypothetical protein BL127_00003635 [Raoultella planticola]|nr:hypothetical protein BL127_00003635 [Raoultella planticola]
MRDLILQLSKSSIYSTKPYWLSTLRPNRASIRYCSTVLEICEYWRCEYSARTIAIFSSWSEPGARSNSMSRLETVFRLFVYTMS